jgi:hypothetical protein
VAVQVDEVVLTTCPRDCYDACSTLELSREMAAEWTRVPAYTDALACLLAPGSATALVDELGARADELRAYGRQMFERWLDLVPVAEPTLNLASTPD